MAAAARCREWITNEVGRVPERGGPALRRGQNRISMQIRAGYEIIYNCPQDTPMILMVHVHYSRASDIVDSRSPDHRSVRADHVPSGYIRQLVQPHRCAHRPDSIERQRGHARHGQTGRRAFPMPGSTRSGICPKRLWCSCWAAAIARRICCRRRLGTYSPRPPGMAARPGDLRLRP